MLVIIVTLVHTAIPATFACQKAICVHHAAYSVQDATLHCHQHALVH